MKMMMATQNHDYDDADDVNGGLKFSKKYFHFGFGPKCQDPPLMLFGIP